MTGIRRGWVGMAWVAALGCLFGCGSDSSGTAGGGGAGGSPSGGSGAVGVDGGGGWAGTGGAPVGGSGGSAGLPPLPCDPGFSFSQNPATAGVAFDASFTDGPGHAYVDLVVTGPGSPVTSWGGVTGSGPYTWTWTVSGHGAGVLELVFMKDKNGGNPGSLVASCQIHSLGGGTGGTGGTGGSGGGGTGGTSTGPPPVNRYGMGYTTEGNASDHDLTAKLAGPGGYVLVIFADITPNRTSAEPSWKQSIADAYARDLIPVIRMAPPWGDRKVRNMGESPTSYKQLAQAYVAVIQDLPLRPEWPIYVEVHNEPNLCYEWECDSGTLTDQQIAAEYAHLLRDVADALHGVGDPRIQVVNAGLAPGGVQSCECGTSNFTPGTLSTTFLGYMNAAVPGVFDQVDVFASHSYPAKGEGWGFFAPYAEAMPGLSFFEKELSAIGKPGMKVLLTETGWTIQHESYDWSRDQVADWTVEAYQSFWLGHPNILGVTPFILRDASWDKFAWVEMNGNPYPVYTKVRAYRCAQPGAQSCQ